MMGKQLLNVGKYLVEVIDAPNVILTEKEKGKIVDDCVIVARKGFGNDKIPISDIEEHAINVNTAVFLRDEEKKIIGFGGSVLEQLSGNSLVHLKGTAILPEHQGHSLYKVITPLRILKEAEKLNSTMFYIGTRTQNPIVFQYMSQNLKMYPMHGIDTPEDILQLAEKYAILVREKHSDPSFLEESRRNFKFDRQSMVVRRAYAGSMFSAGNIPRAKDETVDAFVRSNLDFENGDAFILCGTFDRGLCLNTLEQLSLNLDKGKALYNSFSSVGTPSHQQLSGSYF